MKKLLLLLLSPIILSSTTVDETQYALLENYNGWEFLEWSWNKIQVEKELVKQSIKFDPGSPNQKQGPTTQFEYLGLNTKLAFDMDQLYDIQQQKYFTKNEGESAVNFLNTIKSHYTSNYGEPEISVNKEENSQKIKWKTKYTKISLYYRYDSEVIEAFENETYIIYIQINKNNEN